MQNEFVPIFLEIPLAFVILSLISVDAAQACTREHVRECAHTCVIVCMHINGRMTKTIVSVYD